MYSVFFQILSSWEVIVTIIVILIILPLTFYITAHQKRSSYDYIGFNQKSSRSKSGEEENSPGDERSGDRRRDREETMDNQQGNDADEEKDKYEVLKRLKDQ
jgi:FtsZ-interacting cell division protein ZipA